MQAIIDILILTCFTGFVVLAALSWYWFRYKYPTRRLWKYANQFLWVFIV